MKNKLTILTALMLALLRFQGFTQESEHAEKVIRQLEENRRLASLHGDIKGLEEIFDPGFYEINAKGKIRTWNQNRDDRTKGLLRFESLSFDSIQIKVINDVAIVTGIVNGRGTYANNPFEQHMIRYSRIYVYRKKKWQIIFGQNTQIADN